MKNFIQTKIQSRSRLHPDFKTSVKQARSVLLQVKQKVDEAEKRGVNLENLVQLFYKPLEEDQEKFLVEIDHLANNFTDEEHIIHKDFLRDQLAGLFWEAPLHQRALLKPLGYAGDYEMIRMLHDSNPFQGPSSYFKIMNALGCRCISGRATVARVPYLIKKFLELEKYKRFSVLDIACGPSIEIQEWIKKNPYSDAEFYLVDQDPEAISFSQKAIQDIKRENGSTLPVSFHSLPIKDLLTSNLTQEWPRFDLIYSAGLFDYFDDTIFCAALLGLWPLVAEGGSLLVGNLSPSDYSKTAKWYLDDWPLIYRTEENLRNIASIIPDPKIVSIETEETGINFFLNLKKSAMVVTLSASMFALAISFLQT